jgi:hypothetical protein
MVITPLCHSLGWHLAAGGRPERSRGDEEAAADGRYQRRRGWTTQQYRVDPPAN